MDFPRVCGGDPLTIDEQTHALQFSPRMRGSSHISFLHPPAGKIFPSYAGVIPISALALSYRANFPAYAGVILILFQALNRGYSVIK